MNVPVILACFDEEDEDIQWCLMSNLDMGAYFLSSPIAISPTLPDWPYSVDDLGGQVDDSNCDVRSRYPGWRVDNFLYRHYSSNSNASASVGGSTVAAATTSITKDSYYDVSFELTNAVMNATVGCYARLNETAWPNPDHDPLWADCVMSSSPGPSGTGSTSTIPGSATIAGAQSAVVRTQVLVDREYGLLGINQTWRCLDGSSLPAGTLYSGVGYLAPVQLQCGSPLRSTLYAATAGDGGGVGAGAGTAASSGAAVARVAIGTASEFNCTLPASPPPPPLSGWANPAPAFPHTAYANSCTVNSVNIKTLLLTEYSLVDDTQKAATTPTSSVIASLAFRNPGSGDEFRMAEVAFLADGNWHACNFGGAPYPWQLTGCQYMLDRAGRKLGFQLAWYCDDRDPLHP